MTRKTPDPTPRLKSLTAARARVQAGETVNADTLGQIVGLTWRSIKPLIEEDPSFPVLRRGSEGIAWQFDAGAVLDHMIAQLNEQLAERKRENNHVAKMVGAKIVGKTTTDIAELGKLIGIVREVHRMKVDQGKLIDADAEEREVIAYNNVVQTTLMESAQRADPTGSWPPEIRKAWEDMARNALVEIQDAANRWADATRKAARRA